jgi:signal transduction histidine kinase/DNA-binding response OmpR family regulator
MSKISIVTILIIGTFHITVAQQSSIDSLNGIINSQAQDIYKLASYKSLISMLAEKDFVKAEAEVQKAIDFASKLSNREEVIYFELQRARLKLQSNEFRSALNIAEEMLGEAKAKDYPLLAAESFLIISNVNASLKKDSLAIVYGEKALSQFSEFKDKQGVVKAYENLGDIYSVGRNLDKAILNYLKAIDISEVTGDHEYLSRLLTKTGVTHFSKGSYKRAITYYNQAIEIDKSRGNEIKVADNYNNIGESYGHLGNDLKAIDYFKKSFDIFTKLNLELKVAKTLGNMGLSYQYLRDFNKSHKFFKKVLKIYKKANDSSAILNTYYQIGVTFILQNKKDLAESYFIEASKGFKALGDKKGYSNSLGQLASIYTYRGKYEKALTEYTKVLAVHREIDNPLGVTFGLMNIGMVYLRNLKKEEKAFDFFNEAFAICKEKGFSNWLRVYFNDIGSWYTVKGKIPEALKFYYDALEISEEMKDTAGIAAINNSLASVHEFQKNLPEALSYQKKALKYYQLLNHISKIAETHNAMASLYIRTEQYEKGIDYASQALSSFQTLQDSCAFSDSFLHMGKAYSALGKKDSARYFLKKSIAQASKCKLPFTLAQGYLERGKINEKQLHKAQAFNDYEKSYKYAKQSGNKSCIKEAAAQLFPLYAQRGSYKKAFETLNSYQASKDSLFNEKNTRDLVQKEMQYAFNKAEQQKALARQQEEMAHQQQLERQKWFTYMFIGGFIFSILIALVVYRNYRNKQKANMLLRKQKAELEELDNIKSHLFANISHELRTPLTLISSPVESLLNNGCEHSPEIAKKLKLVQRNSQKLKGLVDDILDLSKLEANKIELNEESYSLHTLLKRIFSNFESLAEHLGINYSIDLTQIKEGYAFLDVAKLEKILNNLLSNAIKNTSSGGKVTLKAQLSKRHLTFEVVDTGQGIAKKDLPFIFNRFYQSKQPDAPLQGGTGIGLALAKELTHLMGGKIQAESTVGHGSTFSLKIPFKPAKPPIEINKTEVEVIEEDMNLDHLKLSEVAESEKHYSILVVEDNRDMQQFLKGILTIKYNVTLAGNGKEALSILAEKRIDLICSDVMMPEMDGYSLLEQLKASDKYKHIPVVMLTALDTKENKLNALTLGVDDYLTKPFSPEELMARTYNLLIRYEVRKEMYTLLLSEPLDSEIEKVAHYPEDTEREIDGAPETDLEWLEKVALAIRETLEEPDIQMADLARRFHLSERQFHRKVKSITGMPPKKYQQEIALQKARYLLEKRQYGNVTAICYAAGMSNVSRFSKLYEARFGKKPKKYFSNTVTY